MAIVVILFFVKKKSHTKKLNNVEQLNAPVFYENPVALNDNYFSDPLYETIDEIVILENSHYEA